MAAERQNRPTIRQVAAHAGVGFKTVARVVNGEPNVAPATAAKVQKALDELGYVPDESAGSLRRAGGRTRTIGLTISNVANPLAAQIHGGVEAVAMAHNVATFAASLNEDPEAELAHTAAFLRRRVDGLILTAVAASQKYLQRAVDRGTPIVFVDREPVDIHTDRVVVDNAGATKIAIAHLARHGHRRIAHLGDLESIQTARERRRGYLETVRELELHVDEDLLVLDLPDELHAYDATRRLMHSPNPPTAIHSAQNLITIGVVRALRDMGLSRQVALVSFDDIPLGDLLEPAVTVISHDLRRIGQVAAERLFARINGDVSPPRKIVVPTQLLVRGSGEIPAA
ncbi:LacI family DNA-binding transcriptional regulator [Kineococcus glutinatus]|uniref:LacI family DNA-binding transcriptional regulator n=1 Tax=Kineococcus glutinatus TaxID=1070872 RepID=A0ABP9H9Y7_9ACTN